MMAFGGCAQGRILSHSALHADETPVQMLKPGTGKTHRAYLWAYAAGAFEDTKAVVYDFCESRAGENAKAFLDEWRGKPVCDDSGGSLMETFVRLRRCRVL